MIRRYVFEIIISSCWKVLLWTSANVAKSFTRSVSVEKPRIPVQNACNVTSQRKGAST